MDKRFKNKGFVMNNVDEDTVLLTGFEHCITGVVDSFHGRHVVYDKNKIINTLMEDSEMGEIEAYEYFDYNIRGAFLGNCTPLFDIKNDTYAE